MSAELEKPEGDDELFVEDTLDRVPTDVRGSLSDLIDPSKRRQRAELVVVAGRNAGQSFLIGTEPMVIGRSSRSQVRLLDEGISRSHARITMNNNEVRIEDLGSANGVLRNDARIRSCTLKDGDQVRLGSSTILRFNWVDEVRKRLEHADRLAAIGQLAAGVAHEMNNPTAYLLANLTATIDHVKELRELFTQLDGGRSAPEHGAAREPLERSRHLLAELDEMAHDNLEGIERIQSIAKELRWFSRLERDGMERLSLHDVAQAANKMVAGQIKPRARIEIDVDPSLTLWAESAKLTQVLVNLLLNAAQAMSDKREDLGIIRVSATAEGENVSLAVEDDGPGVPRNLRDRIFEPFFTTKDRELGTGLGLALCADIVRKHGGLLTVHDSDLGGARFVACLPVSPRLQNTGDRRRTSGPARVLVIDDDAPLLRAMRRSLGSHHEVVVAGGGEEALRLLDGDRKFDVVFCDLVMPDVDGVGVYETLRLRAPELLPRLVFWTGGTFNDRLRTFVSSISNVCLGKPVSEQALLEIITQVRSSATDDDSSADLAAG